MAELLTRLFPLWVVLFGGLAMWQPAAFTWFKGPWIVWSLAGIMLGMGLTLTAGDFRRVLAVPRPILLGLIGQFTIMPALGFLIATLMGLPPALAAGLILVSCCPGGTASNVVAYLARANVALSVSMTAMSTAASVFATPMLTAWLAGAVCEVDAWGLFRSTLQVVVLPVSLGVALNTWAPKRWTSAVVGISPVVSVALIVMIVSSILAANTDRILGAAAPLMGAVILLHAGGFALGHTLGRVFGYDEAIRRTISIEVGMQNSGLAAVLATRHFPDPMTAAPAALSAATHCILGSILAARWRQQVPATEAPQAHAVRRAA